jgi:preprotein translocase subunit YajC
MYIKIETTKIGQRVRTVSGVILLILHVNKEEVKVQRTDNKDVFFTKNLLVLPIK